MYVLRSYRPEDFGQVIDLFLLNTPQYFCPEEQQDLEHYLQSEIEYYSVLEDKGHILATGGCNIVDGIGRLSWYIVHPHFHGQGLGRQLVAHNLQILKSHPNVINGIEVRTSQLACQFYQKFGFVLRYTKDNYWGTGMHLYHMELLQ